MDRLRIYAPRPRISIVTRILARLRRRCGGRNYEKKGFACLPNLGEMCGRIPHVVCSIPPRFLLRANPRVFKRGITSDYERALPDLVRFSTNRKGRDSPFDVERAARLELMWISIVRERTMPRDLARPRIVQSERYRCLSKDFSTDASALKQ